MATSFGALCTDFYVNQTLGVKMDLPGDRETVLHLFDRVRSEMPSMQRFKRFADELALESPRREGEYRWMALRQNAIRSGHINPERMDDAYALHRLLLEITPYFLSISPLDVDVLEVLFGFDLECKANHHQIVQEALFAGTPLAGLADIPGARPVDLQPVVGLSLDRQGTEAFFEVKTRTTPGQVRANRYRTEPISVFLTLRRPGPIGHVDELATLFDELAGQAERLTTERLVPHVLSPISRAIIGSA
jgi:hypothetical protein